MKMTNITLLVLVSALIAQGPQTLLADQPSSGLDPQATAQTSLAAQKAGLERLESELEKAKGSKQKWTYVTVGTSVVAVITAIPSVIVAFNGTKNLIQGERFFGDPDSGGALIGIPVLMTAAVPVTIYGLGVRNAQARIQMRTADIERLLKAIAQKKETITQTEALLESLN